MTWGLVAVAGSTLVGAYGANKAAKAQLQGAREGAAAEERMFNKQVQLQEPFRQVGVNALPDLVAASQYTPFGMEQFQADPGYGFRLKEGIRALENSAAARGGLLSGNTMRGITRFGQGLASEEYDKAFNRYQAGFASRLNPLQALAGVGQTSSNTLTNAAGQLGSNLSNLAVGAGNARASAYAGTANALASGIGQGLNYYQGQQAQKQQQQNFDTYMNYLQG
jgi:hypothetical protein